MSEYKVQDFGCISDAIVYGLDESIKRAKYPMSTDVSKLNGEMTNGILRLAQSDKGDGHDNWLNGVIVQFDLTYTVKAWTEEKHPELMDIPSRMEQPN